MTMQGNTASSSEEVTEGKVANLSLVWHLASCSASCIPGHIGCFSSDLPTGLSCPGWTTESSQLFCPCPCLCLFPFLIHWRVLSPCWYDPQLRKPATDAGKLLQALQSLLWWPHPHHKQPWQSMPVQDLHLTPSHSHLGHLLYQAHHHTQRRLLRRSCPASLGSHHILLLHLHLGLHIHLQSTQNDTNLSLCSFLLNWKGLEGGAKFLESRKWIFPWCSRRMLQYPSKLGFGHAVWSSTALVLSDLMSPEGAQPSSGRNRHLRIRFLELNPPSLAPANEWQDCLSGLSAKGTIGLLANPEKFPCLMCSERKHMFFDVLHQLFQSGGRSNIHQNVQAPTPLPQPSHRGATSTRSSSVRLVGEAKPPSSCSSDGAWGDSLAAASARLGPTASVSWSLLRPPLTGLVVGDLESLAFSLAFCSIFLQGSTRSESGMDLHYTRRHRSSFPVDCLGSTSGQPSTYCSTVLRSFRFPRCTPNTTQPIHTHTESVSEPRLSPWESGCWEWTLRQPAPLPVWSALGTVFATTAQGP